MGGSGYTRLPWHNILSESGQHAWRETARARTRPVQTGGLPGSSGHDLQPHVEASERTCARRSTNSQRILSGLTNMVGGYKRCAKSGAAPVTRHGQPAQAWSCWSMDRVPASLAVSATHVTERWPAVQQKHLTAWCGVNRTFPVAARSSGFHGETVLVRRCWQTVPNSGGAKASGVPEFLRDSQPEDLSYASP